MVKKGKKNARITPSETGILPEEGDDSMELLGYYMLLTAVFVGAVLVYRFAHILRGPSLEEGSENGENGNFGTHHGSATEK